MGCWLKKNPQGDAQNSTGCHGAYKGENCRDDSSRRRSGKSCAEYNEPKGTDKNVCWDIAPVSRRRNWGGEAKDTCQKTCMTGPECCKDDVNRRRGGKSCERLESEGFCEMARS